MAPAPIAAVIYQVGVESEVAPAFGECTPVAKMSELLEAGAHDRGGRKNESVSGEFVAKRLKRVGLCAVHEASVAKLRLRSRANREKLFRATDCRSEQGSV
jgi:hypothetical protein